MYLANNYLILQHNAQCFLSLSVTQNWGFSFFLLTQTSFVDGIRTESNLPGTVTGYRLLKNLQMLTDPSIPIELFIPACARALDVQRAEAHNLEHHKCHEKYSFWLNHEMQPWYGSICKSQCTNGSGIPPCKLWWLSDGVWIMQVLFDRFFNLFSFIYYWKC